MKNSSIESTSVKKKAKLLYVVSLGHSGSTLLDLVCSTIPKVFSMGEMQFLSWQLKNGEKKEEPQSYCSCGKYFDTCEFWSPILTEMSQKKGYDIFENPEKINFSINRGIIRTKKYFSHKLANKIFRLSYTNSFFRIFRWVVYHFYKKSIENTWQLYDRVADKSASELLVDSSKSINRALLLKMYRPKDVKILILKRDVKGVASSSHHGLNDTMIKERTAYWFDYYNKKIPAYLKNIPQSDYMEVTYENMCLDHNELRKKIAKFSGLGTTQISPVNHIAPYKNHTVQGNPMRLLKKNISIRYDERWRERLNDDQVKWINSYIEK